MDAIKRFIAVASSEEGAKRAEGLTSLPGAALTSISLRDRMSPVKDQLVGPMCSAFATIGCLEVFHNKTSLSESHLNDAVARRVTGCKAGLPLIECFWEVVKGGGIVSSADFSYFPDKICFEPPLSFPGKQHYKFEHWNIVAFEPDPNVFYAMYLSAHNTEARSRLAIPKVESLKRVMSQYLFPIALDIPIYTDASGGFTCNWAFGPDIEMPSAVDAQSWLATNSPANGDGWHAVTICGFDDASGRLQFKNSWGAAWGDYGYGSLPYAYVELFSRIQVAGWIGPPAG